MPDFPREGLRIPTQAYEDYHDYPARDPASVRAVEKVIKSFHFAYRSDAKRRCVRTDDDSYDSWPWNQNSNRAQFSFNEHVVASGVLGEWRLVFPVASPFERTADNRTRVVKYQTSNGNACVTFAIPLVPQEYIIRINDLEGREAPPSNRRLREKRWPGLN